MKNNETNESVEDIKKKDWKKFLVTRYGFPEEYEIIKNSELKSLRRKQKFNGALIGICLLVSILVLSGVIFYAAFNDKFMSTVDLVCESSNLSCGNTEVNIPDCNCDTVCGDCIVPEEITVKYLNESG